MLNRKLLLYAENDSSFADLLMCALREGGYSDYTLKHVRDGEGVMAYLKGVGEYQDRVTYPLPGVIVLDSELPRKSGFEVLQWIRQQPEVCVIPVVMLTSLNGIQDVQKAYRLGANSFIVKPFNVHELKNMMKMLDSYWMFSGRKP